MGPGAVDLLAEESLPAAWRRRAEEAPDQPALWAMGPGGSPAARWNGPAGGSPAASTAPDWPGQSCDVDPVGVDGSGRWGL